MPELIEVEQYRRALEPVLGRRITGVHAPDPWFLKGGADAATVAAALVDERIEGLRRRGKLLLVDTSGPTLGLRFGMTGLVEVDGARPVDELLYASARRDPAWVRFALRLDPGEVAVVDPRRLGGVALDPDESRLGPDAAAITGAQLRAALAGSGAPLQARLLDQARVAGVGNLIADEVLWRASLDPTRAAGSLDEPARRRLQRHLRATIDDLLARGGSHQGRLMAARRPGGCCPRDGAPLRRSTVGGRTTWWCPAHQR